LSEATNLLNADDGKPNFFTPVSERLNLVREKLKQTEKDIEEVRGYHSAILSSPTTDQNTNDRLDFVMKSIQTNIRKIGAELKDIDTEANDYHGTGKITSTELRMLRNIQKSLISQLRHVYDELQGARSAFEDRCKLRIQRSLEIAGYDVTEADVDEALEKGTQIFYKEFAETQSTKLALRDIQERHSQLIGLEKNIEELRDMFVDLSTMISLQGEVIDRIEMAVTIATEDVSNAQQQLQSAEVSKKKYRKKKCCIILAVVCLIAVVVAVLVFTFI